MSKNQLNEIVDRIKLLRADAELPVENWDPSTRPGIEMRKRRAAEALPVEMTIYKKELLSRALSVIVLGEDAEEFAKIAKEEFGCFTVKTNQMYEDIAKAVLPTTRAGGQFESTQMNHVVDELMSIGRTLGIAEMPAPRMQSNYVRPVTDLGALADTIKLVVEDAMGTGLNRMYIQNLVAEEAAKEDYCLPILPVVFVGTKASASFSVPGSTFLVGPKGSEFELKYTNKDSVAKALTAAKRKFGLAPKKRDRSKGKNQAQDEGSLNSD